MKIPATSLWWPEAVGDLISQPIFAVPPSPSPSMLGKAEQCRWHAQWVSSPAIPFPFPWLAHSFETKMGHPSSRPKIVLTEGRSSSAVNTPIKNALSGPGYMQRVGPDHKPPVEPCCMLCFTERGATFLLFSGLAGNSSWWRDGMAMMYFWEVKTITEWMVCFEFLSQCSCE